MKRNPIQIIILGNGESELSSSFYIQIAQKRYLFNVPEGIQRQFVEDKLRIGSMNQIFLTSNDWSCWGGYISLLVSYFSSHIPSIPLHCCSELNQFLLDADMVPIENAMYQCMKKWTHDETPFYDEIVTIIPIVTDTHSLKTINYHILLPTFIGKFDKEKAIELNIPDKLRGKLIKGETVTLENGKIIQPSDVCHESECPGMIGILHFPTPFHVDLYLEKYSQQKDSFKSFYAIILIIPSEVRSYQPLIDFISLFPNAHLFYLHDRIGSSCEETISLISKTSFRSSFEIHKIFSSLFPQYAPSYYHQQPSIDSTITSKSFKSSIKCLANSSYSPSMVQYTIYPQIDYVSLHKNETLFQSKKLKQLIEMKQNENCQKSNQFIQTQKQVIGEDNNSFQLLLIGTGGAIPSRTRNGSCEVLFVNGKTIVIDCGECNAFQLINCGINPEDIDLLYITHFHSDHMYGVFSLIEFSSKPLTIVGPVEFGHTLNVLCQSHHKQVHFYPHSMFSEEYRYSNEYQQVVSEIENNLGMSKIITRKLVHNEINYGIRFEFNSNSLVITGDTYPCEDDRLLCMNADYVIHECNFEDGLENEALKRQHSTPSLISSCLKDCNIKLLILNHIGQRSLSSFPDPLNCSSNENDFSLPMIYSFDGLLINESILNNWKEFQHYYSLVYKELHSDIL